MYDGCPNCAHNKPSDYCKYCRFCFLNGRKHYLPKHTTDQERRNQVEDSCRSK